MKKGNKGFLHSKLDAAFDFLSKGFIKTTIFFSSKLGEAVATIHDTKEKSKDLVKTNIDVAEKHLMNNNLFDAKLRYKFILKLEKENYMALSALGYIYAKERKFEKALFYLEKSLLHVPNEEERLETEAIINKIKGRKNA